MRSCLLASPIYCLGIETVLRDIGRLYAEYCSYESDKGALED